jgi:hypothetical protein
MSVLNKLTEGIVNRNLAQEGQALLNKWTQTGLLEGLQTEHDRHNMARLLENQAKELLRESSSMTGGDVEGFAAVAFPIVRRVFAGLIANDLVSVQPMSLPSGLIFFLDFTYSGELGDNNSQLSRMGNKVGNSIYGTDKVGSGIISGVNLADAKGGDQSGLLRAGGVGYAYGSPTGSNISAANDLDDAAVVASINLDGSLTETQMTLLDFDVDLISKSSGAVIVLDIAEDHFTNMDFENLSAMSLVDCADQANTTGLAADLNASTNLTVTAISNIQQVRRLTRRVSSDSRGAPYQSGITSQAAAIRFFIASDESQTESTTAVVVGAALPAGTVKHPVKDTIGVKSSGGGALDSYSDLLEGVADIPEIDIKVDSTAITAQTKKLKAKWTPELGQDLQAYHNLDAEVELTSILSEQIALEIDREILADLVNGATASTFYWSRSPGIFVNRETGAQLGAISGVPEFTGTVSEWYETLIETINDVSAQIHRKTLRGGANFVVCGPEVANIMEFTAGFRANVTADADKGDIGAVKVGSLNRKFDVIVDPYFLRNVVLVGRRGNSFLESGYVYAPYVPLQTTPTIFGPEDFVPRKGVMTRYAKKMVRPDMYGLVVVRGLLGEEIS